jgi:hypothetical protein
MVRYVFDNPKKEGKLTDGTDFYTVEIKEIIGTSTTRITRISQKDAKAEWITENGKR